VHRTLLVWVVVWNNVSKNSGPTNGRRDTASSVLSVSALSLILGKSSERPGAVKGARFVRGEANP
jgi:hypothetical protein